MVRPWLHERLTLLQWVYRRAILKIIFQNPITKRSVPKKKLKENKGLPTNWRFKDGAYRYRVPEHLRHLWDNKSEFKLGKTLIEAHRTYADRAEVYIDARMIGQLCDKYLIKVLPLKAKTTQDREVRCIELIRKVFDSFPIRALEPHHVYKFRDRIDTAHGPHTANRCVAVLSHMYTCAIEWGDAINHPIKNKVLKIEVDQDY